MKMSVDPRDGTQSVRFLEFPFFIPPRASGIAATAKNSGNPTIAFYSHVNLRKGMGGPTGIFLLTWVLRTVVGEGSRALFPPGRPAADPDSDSVGEGGSAMSPGR